MMFNIILLKVYSFRCAKKYIWDDTKKKKKIAYFMVNMSQKSNYYWPYDEMLWLNVHININMEL